MGVNYVVTGKRSGRRNPNRPNWRQVLKAKAEKQQNEYEAKKKARAKTLQAKAKAFAHANFTVEKIDALEQCATCFEAGFNACRTGDALFLAWHSWLRAGGRIVYNDFE